MSRIRSLFVLLALATTGFVAHAQTPSLDAARDALSRRDWPASQRMIEAALADEPKHLEWLLLKGVWLSESGQPAQAEAFLAPLADAFPEWAPLHNNLALAQAKQQRYEAAFHTMQRALMARPRDPLLLENLKRLESLRGW
ncbi:MAG: hypothetical protein RLZZ397_183 [Pseudomonadota bacterium]